LRCARKTSPSGSITAPTFFPPAFSTDAIKARQTAYGIELFGRRLEVVELGTAARHQVGVETQLSLPKKVAGLIAIPDRGVR